MAGRTLILGGGIIDYSFTAEYLSHQEFDIVVCADSGLNAAKKLGLGIDFLMGDFDSADKEMLNSFMEANSHKKGTNFVKYPAEKDYTDLHLALGWAVDKKPSEIIILGATGGRLDHLVANINILMLPMKNNIPAYIIDRNNKLCLIQKSYSIEKKNAWGKYISVYPFTEKVTGVNFSGVKYPLKDAMLEKGTSLTVSNEFAEDADKAVILLEKGILMVIQSRD